MRIVSSLLGAAYLMITPSQLKDAAKGLIYMHSHAMIHGDLKGV